MTEKSDLFGKLVVDFLNESAELGFFFECGTLVFNDCPRRVEKLQLVVNHVGGDYE